MPTEYTKDNSLGDYLYGQAMGAKYNTWSSLGADHAKQWQSSSPNLTVGRVTPVRGSRSSTSTTASTSARTSELSFSDVFRDWSEPPNNTTFDKLVFYPGWFVISRIIKYLLIKPYLYAARGLNAEPLLIEKPKQVGGALSKLAKSVTRISHKYAYLICLTLGALLFLFPEVLGTAAGIAAGFGLPPILGISIGWLALSLLVYWVLKVVADYGPLAFFAVVSLSLFATLLLTTLTVYFVAWVVGNQLYLAMT